MQWTTKSEQKWAVNEMIVRQDQAATYVMRLTPESQDAAGNWIVGFKILALKKEIDIGGNRVEFDSAKQAPARSAGLEFMRALTALELQVQFDPDMQVRKISGYDAFLQKVAAKWRRPVQKDYGEPTIKAWLDSLFDGVPGRAVRRGQSFARERTFALGPLGYWVSRSAFSYEGDKNGLDVIQCKTTSSHHALSVHDEKLLALLIADLNDDSYTVRQKATRRLEDFGSAAVPALKRSLAGDLSLEQRRRIEALLKHVGPLFIIRSGLKSSAGTGCFLFDRAKGQVHSGETTFSFAGPMTIDIGGVETDLSIEHTERIMFQTSDRDPLK
jgi:hypothetical protein